MPEGRRLCGGNVSVFPIIVIRMLTNERSCSQREATNIGSGHNSRANSKVFQ